VGRVVRREGGREGGREGRYLDEGVGRIGVFRIEVEARALDHLDGGQ